MDRRPGQDDTDPPAAEPSKPTAESAREVVDPPLARSSLWTAAYGSTDEPLVSVLLAVPAQADVEAVDRTLRAFAAVNTYPAFEIVIVGVGAGASAPALEAARRWSSMLPIRLTATNEKGGLAEAINRAAADARGTLLLLLDGRAVLAADCLRQMARALADPSVGAVSLKHYKGSSVVAGEPPIDHIGIRFTWSREDRGLVPDPIRPGAADALLALNPATFPAAFDTALMCRRKEYLALGGLEPGYSDGFEGVDLSCKIRFSLNKQIVFLNDLHLFAPPRAADPVDVKRNRRRLLARWGYALRRDVLRRRWSDDGAFTGRPPTVGIAVTTTDMGSGAGDLYTAWGLGEALRRLYGWRVRYLPQEKWRKAAGLDVYIAMRDKFDIRSLKNPEPHLVKVAWMRNWVDRWTERPWFDNFDIRLCSSEHAASFVQTQTGVPAEVLPIAVDPHLFGLGPVRPEYEADYIFTGNRWEKAPPRELESFDPRSSPYRFKAFGRNWDKHPVYADYAGGFVPYESLPAIYNSAKLTVDDAVVEANKPWGSVNSRVFEALAAGSLVITNNAKGSEELFGGRLPVWTNADDIGRLVRHYLEAPQERDALARALRDEVIGKHTYDHRARALHELLLSRANVLRIAIKCPVPHMDEAHAWGDYHFGRSLKRALVRLGYQVRIDILPDWRRAEALADDVVIVLRGLSAYEPAPGQINICWLLSHPRKATADELGRYDHVFVASEAYSRKLQPHLGDHVSALLQCSDPDVFHPPAHPRPAEDYLFVGNSRRSKRKIVSDSIDAGLPLAVYGREWEGMIPHEYVRGEHIMNDALHEHYGSAKLVLNDHWPDMAEEGFVSNRLFDVALCGGFVVSDTFAGAELFEGMIATYGPGDDLKAICERWLADEPERRRRARRAREFVLAGHTFAHRAAEIDDLIKRLHASRLSACV
jgi:spore maturation protein CgeB